MYVVVDRDCSRETFGQTAAKEQASITPATVTARPVNNAMPGILALERPGITVWLSSSECLDILKALATLQVEVLTR
jgi:hypothetical protein